MPTVPHMMNRFIPRFFSCTECGLHFAFESLTLVRPGESAFPKGVSKKELKRIGKDHKGQPLPAPKSLEEAILWLNSLHNRVNLRLAGKPSEDPKAPKVIFPSVKDCGQCYSERAKEMISHGMLVFPDKTSALKQYLVDLYRPSSWKVRNVPADSIVSFLEALPSPSEKNRTTKAEVSAPRRK